MASSESSYAGWRDSTACVLDKRTRKTRGCPTDYHPIRRKVGVCWDPDLPPPVPSGLRCPRLMQFLQCRYGRRRCGLADDQLRFYSDNLRKLRATDSFQQRLCSEFAHASQRLANRGEARVLECGALDVVEADHRNLARYFDSGIKQSANRADCRDVVEGEQRGEVTMLRQQRLSDVVAGLRSWRVGLELCDQIGIDRQPQLARRVANRCPTRFRVRTERLSLDERDVAMPKLEQMFERKNRRLAMIEHNVRNPG